MGLTISQKILEKHLVEGDNIKPGSEIGIKIDQCLTQDSTGTMAWLEFESLGLSEVKCELAVSYCDHTSLAFKGESADDHLFLQTIAQKFGAYYSKPGNGVCHQVHYEKFGIPGKTLLGSDSHTPTAGGIGMLAIGVGGLNVATSLAGAPYFLKVPEFFNIELKNKLNKGVSAKDIILKILKILTVKGGVGKIIEYSGSGLKELSIPDRCTITNMGAETGATTSIFPSDEVTRKFLEMQKRKKDWFALKADDDAEYIQKIEIDLNEIEPLVAMPFSPDNVFSVNELEGTKVRQIYIGSCTNGNYKDMWIAAQILKGEKISNEVDLIISPGSRQVQLMMIETGIYEILTKAGARIIDPGCNACIGIGFVPASDQLSLRTVNRNFEGRGGNPKAKLALSSAEVAAASAITGVITNPLKFIDKIPDFFMPKNFQLNDNLLIPPLPIAERERIEIIRGSNIKPLKPQTELPKKIMSKIIIKVGDNISTDDILPAGPLTQHLRSNLPEISKYTFYYIDKNFYQKTKDNNGGVIVGGENYGQGSSREHAAMVLYELNIRCVLAKSFARIHRGNLINNGIVPIVCNIDKFNENDEVEINLEDLNNISIRNITNGIAIKGQTLLTSKEEEILKAGGLLRYSLNKFGYSLKK
ncbi:MAG TPA: aconitate hydratase [bacterium]|nr:aconitate hydratase [bacterium]HOL48072.1 aconitate hydratase [bacterium]HPQ19093.1 aconitate hydratase [bacterium]